jgi:broad specificity phosphatase PhoE
MKKRSINLVLLRHAQSKGNVDYKEYKKNNNFDIDLSPLGEQQITKLGSIPLFSPLDYIDSRKLIIKCSPMLRAKKTANGVIKCLIDEHKIIENNISLNYDLSLIERHIGDANGYKGLSDFFNHLPEPKKEHDKREQQGILYRPPNGESLYDVYLRIKTFHYNLLHDVQDVINCSCMKNYMTYTVLIVSHCVTLTTYKRFLTGDIEQNPNDVSYDFQDNCSYFATTINI